MADEDTFPGVEVFVAAAAPDPSTLVPTPVQNYLTPPVKKGVVRGL